MRVFVIRHAEPEPLSDACPDHERPLSALGRAQAEALGRAFRSETLDFVIASTMRRAVETAAPLADTLGLTIRQDPRLSEIDLGLLTSWGADERAQWAGITARWSGGDLSACCPQGESLADVVTRVEPAVNVLLERPCEHGFAVVGHAVANSVVLSLLCPELRAQLGQNLWISHAGVWELEGKGRSFRVVRRDDVGHLRGEGGSEL